MAQESNHNHRPVGQAPPKKKRKRSQETYEEFVNIIGKLSKSEFDSKLFHCFGFAHGVICDDCTKDTSLKGYFTALKPVIHFNYTKLIDHIKTKKHYKRIIDPDIKALHPLHSIGTTETKCSEEKSETNTNETTLNAPTYIITKMERIQNAALLIHLIIKQGQPLTKVEAFNSFYDDRFIEHQLNTNWYTDAFIDAMDIHQKKQDKIDIFGENGCNEFAMALDGSSKKIRSVKIFDIKGWKKGTGPITRYAVCLDSKKSIKDENVDLTDLFTTDTGEDNVAMIEKVVAYFGVTDWSQLIELALDGAGQNMGEWKGCGPEIRRKHNVFMLIEWCMTHKGNLLGKNGWKHIQYIINHFKMQKLLYSVFSQKVMSQLYIGVCILEDERSIAPKNDSETRFNSQLKPTENINKTWKTIALSLKFVNKEKQAIKKYKQDYNKYRQRRIGDPPTVPAEVTLYDYWLNLDRVILNCIVELVLTECEKFGNIVGTTNKDIVSNYHEIDELEMILTTFKSKSLKDFISTTANDHNPVHTLLNRLDFDDVRKIVRFGDHFQWTVSYEDLNSRFEERLSELSEAILQQIPKYFKNEKRQLMSNIQYLYDPSSFKIYDTFNDTQNHEHDVLKKVFDWFKYKKLRVGPNSSSFRKFTSNNLNFNQFKCEYMNVKRLCCMNKSIYPKDMAQRLLFIVLKMEEKSNMFVMNLMIMKKVMIYFSGIIDVERKNGIKKWMFNARREGMLTQKMDKILRLFCNSPDPKDKVHLLPWIHEVMKIFWSDANRRIECQELDDICDNQ